MQQSANYVLHLLGWDAGKEFVVYQLRAGSWEASSVWDGLARGNPEVVHAWSGGRQGFLQLLQRPLQRSVPFTWLSWLLAGLMTEQMRAQTALDAVNNLVSAAA